MKEEKRSLWEENAVSALKYVCQMVPYYELFLTKLNAVSINPCYTLSDPNSVCMHEVNPYAGPC